MISMLNIAELTKNISSHLDTESKDIIMVIHNGTQADDFYFSCWNNKCYETFIPARLHLSNNENLLKKSK